ncbi:hypothetical protein [Chitinophaga lutea]|uniref:hypothetical protein n=1 Tax=Chitinophaga lutea TaxID=2488634 RepID=UPI000F4DD51B|nr:hypothetical protein [Chitinophaga lutea]
MKRQFKRILAVLLLLLYGFIITPVALWHSHSCDSDTHCATKLPAPEKKIAKAARSCLICDHSYTSYIPGGVWFEVINKTEFLPYFGLYNKSIPSLSVLQYNTRGSPTA